MVRKVEKLVEEKNCIKPAYYEYVDTGKSKQVIVYNEDGTSQEIKKPIKEKVFKDAVYETLYIKTVCYEIDDGDEIHSFSTLKEAKAFKKVMK